MTRRRPIDQPKSAPPPHVRWRWCSAATVSQGKPAVQR